MKKLALILILCLSFACEKEESSGSSGGGGGGTTDNTDPPVETRTTRSFYLGFTPWLYAATTQAQTDVYDYLNSRGDLVAHHFQQGIPFNDAATFPNFDNYEQNIKDEVNTRISLTDNDKVIYLAIDSLNSTRNGLTDFWGTSANMARPSPWDTRSFDDANVISSYVNFSLEMIARFNPTYFNYAPEISDLMISNPTEFQKFKTFSNSVYTAIKGAYPNLKIMVSITLKQPGSTNMQTATTGFAEIKDNVDLVGISVYPYAFFTHTDKGDPANLPTNWLSQIQTIAPNQTYAIVETGWIGDNLNIPAYSLSESSDETKQNAFLEKMFEEADDMNMEAIIWFTSHDYTTLWTDTLGSDNVSHIWKDTGLVDDNLVERRASTTWQTWYNYTRSN